jgi:hypothetical protein
VSPGRQTFASSYKVQLLLRSAGEGPVPESLLFRAEPEGGPTVRAAARLARATVGEATGARGDGTFVGDHPSAVHGDRVFDAMWEVASTEADWGAMGRLAAERLADLEPYCDLAFSAVSAGTEWTLVPGGAEQDATMLLYPMRRLSRLTPQEFHDYWLYEHGRFGIGNPNVAGYRQFHVDRATSSAVNAGLGLGVDDFDGVAESFLPTPEAFAHIKTNERTTRRVLADEARFIDDKRSATMELYRYRVLVPGESDEG